MAAVFAVNDPAKSEELWNQILSIVAMAGFHDTHPRDITIEGTKARLYHFQGAPPIVVVRTPERELIVGTEDAAGAALRASRSHDSIRNDASYSKVLAKLTPTSSKADARRRGPRDANREISFRRPEHFRDGYGRSCRQGFARFARHRRSP